uniref:hypothetical protein n=1 Tax=Wolbachia endosymbiont (group A) of Anoplius nigerrimus TaxID=2953979 RepID=UPI00222FD443|nr:hypothetical protein [Wolbachia endosymbiont (group A) of Anoplius nigerrimus]
MKTCSKTNGGVYKRISATNRKRFAAIHKHQKKLNIKINDCRIDKNNIKDIEIAIDSTSISIYNNTSEGK